MLVRLKTWSEESHLANDKSKVNLVTDLFSTNLDEMCVYAPNFKESQVADFHSCYSGSVTTSVSDRGLVKPQEHLQACHIK